MKVEIKYINEYIKELYVDGGIPKYATEKSAAVDIRTPYDITFTPNRLYVINTGIFMHPLPETGVVASLLIPRSGLGGKGLKLMNTMGLIDQDYQGELIIKAIYEPLPSMDSKYDRIILQAGDRFCQLFFIPILHADFTIVDSFSSVTERGEGGFGHTGV